MHKLWLATSLMSASVWAMLPLSAALAADPEAQYGGEMIYAQAGEQFSLFPGRNLDSGAQDVWLYACEGLVELNEEAEIVPWLAKDRSVADDGKVYTFELQEDVRFP
jgi:peptide/nickel transport system substrate-binding protein